MTIEIGDTPEPEPNMVTPDSFSYTPTEALQIIAGSPDQPLILDLDLTLVFGPTTEAFLDSARPSSYAYVLLSVLDKVSPWRFLPGGQDNRHWMRVLFLLLLMPWSYFRWRTEAEKWTKVNANRQLVDAARNHNGRVVVVTRGFAAIVNPVVDALRLSNDEKVLTIACKVSRWRGLRQFSKTEHVEQSPHLATASDAIMVSGSIQDYDLFMACETPVLTEWKDAYWIQPHENAYVPLRYVQLTKTPFNGFVQAAWIKDDLYIVLLALSLTVWALPIHAIGIGMLSFALWITYETGYYENDVLGSTRETDPVLPTNFDEVRGSVPRFAPWVWALAATVAGAPFIAVGSGRSLTDSGVIVLGWMAVLAFIRLVFAFFNRVPKVHRVVPHLLLQIGKYFGFLAVTAVTPLGVALLATQVAYRWVPYVRYRWSKAATFAARPLHRTRLSVFVVLAVPSLVFIDRSIGQLILFSLAVVLFGRRVLKEKSAERGAPHRPMASQPSHA